MILLSERGTILKILLYGLIVYNKYSKENSDRLIQIQHNFSVICIEFVTSKWIGGMLKVYVSWYCNYNQNTVRCGIPSLPQSRGCLLGLQIEQELSHLTDVFHIAIMAMLIFELFPQCISIVPETGSDNAMVS